MLLLLRPFVIALAFAAAFASASLAQSVDYTKWESLAERAENALDAEDVSQNALEALRSELAAWRDDLLAAQDVNSERIATVQSQIDAIGPPPESGDEPPDVASRRAELEERLAGLRAPRLTAEDAFRRADGLISEIDSTIRAQQADALFREGPTPLNPALWLSAFQSLSDAMGGVWNEVATGLRSDAKIAEAKAALPRIVLMLAIALFLVLRGKRLVTRLVDHLRHSTRRGTGVWSFVASLGEVVLPVLGLTLIVQAVGETGFFGLRGQLLLQYLPYYGAVLLGIRWLAEQVFTKAEDLRVLSLTDADATRGRVLANTLSVILVLRALVGDLSDVERFDAVTRSVLDFPLLLICALLLFQFGRVLLRTQEVERADGTIPTRVRIARTLGRGAMAVAVAGPVAAAVGYANFSEALVYPAIRTLALAGLVLVLLRFLNDLYTFFTGRDARESESLVPVFAGFALALAALPVLALIWGARIADLTEFWARFREGFTLGDTRISPTDFLVFAIVFAVGYLLTKLLQGTLKTSVLPKTRLDIGGQNAIVSGIGYVGIFIAALLAITSAGIDLAAFAIVAGALSVGIGFGLQNIVSNFVSGIILLIERPISEGDWIEVNGQMGIVKDISVRSTRIETFDRTDVIVPNGDFISGTVTNYTRGNLIGRVFVTVGVAYGTDTRMVEQILQRIAREHPLVLTNPEPGVVFARFGADSLEFEVRAIIRDVNQKLKVASEINHQIAEAFVEKGIEIPFAQRDIWLRNPEALPVAPPQEDS